MPQPPLDQALRDQVRQRLAAQQDEQEEWRAMVTPQRLIPLAPPRLPPGPPLPNPEASMTLGEQFAFDPLGSIIQGLKGATIGGGDNQAARFGELAAASLPLVGGAKAMKTALTAGRAAEEGVEAARSIKAYHGSPHDFEKFELAKIGTGEGAQAYGHGLYFAENEAVAGEYRKALAPGVRQYVGGEVYDAARPEHLAASLLDTFSKVDSNPRAVALKELAGDIANPALTDAMREKYRTTYKLLESGGPLPTVTRDKAGRMYEVNIKADPAHFLDWDAPLSQQPEHIRKFVRERYPTQYANMERASQLDTEIRTLADQYGRPGDSYVDAIARAPEDVQQHWRKLLAEHRKVSPVHPAPEHRLPTSGEAIYRDVAKIDEMVNVARGAGAENAAKRLRQVFPDATAHDIDFAIKAAAEPQPVSDIVATRMLKQAGIPGIKYLDQGSRMTAGVNKFGDNWFIKGSSTPYPTEAAARAAADAAGNATRNFVVFDESIIDIAKKYGLAAAAALLMQRQLNPGTTENTTMK